MSSVNKEIIEDKLKKLREVIDKLEQLQKTPREVFLKGGVRSDAAIYNLIIGIENVIDIANHILSQVFQVKAADYSEILKKIGEVGVVPKTFVAKNEGMVNFRNLLVHEYTRVDLDKVYQNLQKAPDTLREFAKYYLEFLEKN